LQPVRNLSVQRTSHAFESNCPQPVLSTHTLAHNDELTSSYSRIQPWLWPNVVSLDAPAIAVLWQLLLARGLRVQLNPVEPLVLALAVWSVYVSDRILDALRPAAGGWEPARKKFYRRHFRAAACVGLCLTALVIPVAHYLLKRSTFDGGLALTIPVICYLALVHLAPMQWRECWPREAVVAFLFTLGTFMGVWIVNGRNIQPLAAPAILLSLLCWANCSAIEAWEWQSSSSHSAVGAPSGSSRWAAKHLSVMATGIAMLAAAMSFLSVAPASFSVAAFGSGMALALLGACRSHLRVSVLRVAADAALCTPLLALVSIGVR